MCTNTPTRRRCLLAIGGAGPLGVAGCLGFDDGDDEPHADAGPYEDSPEPAVTLHSTEVRVTNMGSAVAVFCSDAAIDSTEDIDNGENGATRSDATFPCDGESVVALSEDGSIGVVTTM